MFYAELSELDDDDIAHLIAVLNESNSETSFQLVAELAKIGEEFLLVILRSCLIFLNYFLEFFFR